MRRRQLLQPLGAGVASLGLVSQASAREEGELPNDNVDTTLVSTWPPGKTYHVPAGGWVDSDGGGSEKEDVQRWLDAVEHTMRIDGERIQNPEQYW